MGIIDTQKSIIENLYFLSGPIVAVLGLFIFRQIKLAKDQLIISKGQLEENQNQLKINSQRQAAILAADKVKEYCNEILPLENKLDAEKRKINYPKPNFEIKNFTNDELLEWDKDFVKVFLSRIEDIGFLELSIVNRLEAFSVYFVKGIADEKIAFNSIGEAFCRSVRNCYSTITLLRGSKSPNKYYEILIQLYKCWDERLQNSKAEMEKEELSKEVKDKIKQLEQLRNFKLENEIVNPIGT